MPHSGRNKKSNPQHQKRLEVTDADGWTHVTTGKNVRRALHNNSNNLESPDGKDKGQEELHPQLVPAEAPQRLTLDELQTQFQGYREKWEGSETWRAVEDALRRRVVGSTTPSSLDSILCIGLGSPSGFLRGGWVDRRSVSMFQLAALVSMKELIQKSLPSIQVYAQDPVFNSLDKSLLHSLDITVLDHPHAFTKVSPRTFLYCPGAERTHLDQLLSSNPPIVFGGPLEEIESEIVARFLGTTRSVRAPGFGHNEHAFWNMRLYYLEP